MKFLIGAFSLSILIIVITLTPETRGAESPAAADGPVTVEVPSSRSAMCITLPLPEGFSTEKNAQYVLRCSADTQTSAIPVVLLPSFTAGGEVLNPVGRLTAVIPGTETAANRVFELVPVETESVQQPAGSFTVTDDNKATMTLADASGRILAYNYQTIARPEINDFRNRRACYIHPVWGLDGEVLSDDFPKDHYHHHGIFWSWMHVGIDGKDHDIWMYKDIFHRYERTLYRQDGSACLIGFENSWRLGDTRVEQDAAASAAAESVMKERVWIHAWPIVNGRRYFDLDLFWTVGSKPITLRGAEQKSYGGLTFRFRIPERSGRPAIITSAGVSDRDLPICQLKWADVSANFRNPSAGISPANATAGQPASGASIFIPASHPGDPSRGWPPTWLTRFYGAQCVGWPGVDGQTFQPGQTIHLKYRFVIHRGAETFDSLAQQYEDYTQSEKARIQQ